jgi:hypothetical protein
MESQVTDYLVHDALEDLKGIMNQIVRDLAFHISPQGYHESNSP